MTAAAVNNAEAYKDLEITVFDATTKAMLPMADIVEDLENALGDMGSLFAAWRDQPSVLWQAGRNTVYTCVQDSPLCTNHVAPA